MSRRFFATTAVLLAAVANVAAAQRGGQQPPPAAQTPNAQQPQRPSQPEGPKPYREVITAQAVTDSGAFIIHRIGEKLFYEIPRAMLGREFGLVVDQRGTIRGVGYAGEEVTERVVKWERMGNRVFLRMVGYGMRADSNLPVARAVNLSNQSPILRSFDIAAWSPDDSNAVVEATGLFTQDVAEINARQSLGRRVRRFDPSRSIIERARSFPRNVEVSVLQTYEVDSVPQPTGRADGSVNTITMLMNYSMVLLPDVPMQPRECDNRIGFFSLSFENFGTDRPVVPRTCYITRWRLEPREPSARISAPVKPIVFYIDPATPDKWVPWLIRGVEMWKPVFEAAGFSDAIQARRAPTPQEDPEFDLDDARYSAIRWLPSTVENAYGPHVSDPRTGEILQSNIGWYHNITSLLQAWYWVQVGAVDPRARRLPFPDELMGELVAYVAAHEVGHTLGLPHAMLSSGLYPVDSLRSPTYTRQNGTSYSIMDYARNNYVAQPGDDVQLQPKIGPWDYYTINWGYRRWPNLTTPAAERRVLDSLARLQDAYPMYRFGNMDGIDPRTQRETLGDDPIRATTYGMANLRRLVPMLLPATTADQLEDYDLLNDMYGRLIGQWDFEVQHVLGQVGGVYRHERYPNQAGPIHTRVPRTLQVQAVRFLLDSIFITPRWLLDPEILRRIEPTGSVERIRVRQASWLNTLLQDARLSRLVEQTSFATAADPAYTVADLFGDLRRGIFSELTAGRVPDEYRRNLQRAFVLGMERLISTPLAPPVSPFAGFPGFTPPPPRPADAVALARAELRDLDRALVAGLPRATDRVARAHWQDLRDRIDRILNPR
jgi:hypothetical protein